MAYNGSGVFNLYTPGNPTVTGTVISSTWANNTLSDIATGLSTALTKDGQTTPTANIPLGGFKLTGVGAATARTDAATLANIQDGTGVYVATVGGTADAITLTPSPAITAYAAGQQFSFIASGANTGAVTVAVSGLVAKDVTKNGTTALAAGNIPSGAIVVIEYDGTRFQLINVYVNAAVAGAITTSGLTMATSRMLGRLTASTGAIEELTSTQVTTNFVDAASDSAAGKIEIAVQSEMEAGSSATLAVTPGRQQYHPSAMKVWLSWVWSGGTPTIRQSYNVSSLTDSGTGQVGINFTTNFAAGTFCTTVGWQSADTTTQQQLSISGQAVGSVTASYFNNGGAHDNVNIVSIMCAGDQ